MGTIRIKLSGVESNQGKIICHLYDKKSRWMKPRLAAASKSLSAEKGVMEFELEAPLDKRYALSIHHDENDNQKMDTGFPIPKPCGAGGCFLFQWEFYSAIL